MQIGGRWRAGEQPPRGLPDAFVAAVADAEAKLRADGDTGGSWTLTWLEGLPVAEHDSGVRVTIGGPDAPGHAGGSDAADDDDLFPDD